MSLLKLTWRFLGAVAIIALAPVAQAQDFLPLAEPMEFNPDWQWFAPIDVDELSENSLRKSGNFGWFVSHDRTKVWATRPDRGPTMNLSGDWGFGHKTEIGFARENGGGWLANFTKTTFSTYHATRTDRINRFEPDNDPNDPTQDPIFPIEDRNDPRFQARAYRVDDSLNAGSLTSFDLVKTWRRSPYRYGGILEPLIGLKYTTFTDFTQDQDYARSTGSIITPLAPPTADTQLETLRSFETTNMNRLLGGQIGARYFTNYHRWRLGAEFRTFLAANFQTISENQNTYFTEYGGGPGIGTDVDFTETRSIHSYSTNQRTTWGYEVKMNAAFQVTKYIGLNGGLSVFNLARGIRRGGINVLGATSARDQDVFMAGLNFGLEINR